MWARVAAQITRLCGKMKALSASQAVPRFLMMIKQAGDEGVKGPGVQDRQRGVEEDQRQGFMPHSSGEESATGKHHHILRTPT